MLLENKNTMVYGVGAVGGAVARIVIGEGATLFLKGCSLAGVDAVANDIAVARV